MGMGDISQMTYEEICDICKRYSSGDSKLGKGPGDMISRITKALGGGITREKISNLLDHFKINILGYLNSHMDTLKIKKKKEEQELSMLLFFHK
jgi:hypothetical protein